MKDIIKMSCDFFSQGLKLRKYLNILLSRLGDDVHVSDQTFLRGRKIQVLLGLGSSEERAYFL